ncbi:MAG TPA: hypothetical protein VL096_04310 [Pirellulaceae bacterium]|nr:hypothetical protein [Pirellulaceae bacterium]
MKSTMPAYWNRSRRWGLRVSWVLHLLVISWLVGDWMMNLTMVMPLEASNASRRIEIRMRPLVERNVAEIVLEKLPADAQTSSHVRPVDAEELLAGVVDERWWGLVEPIDETSDRDATDDFVHRELMRIAAAAEQRSTDENIEQLSDLSERLTTISSDKNVGDINQQLQKVLGADARATKPAAEQVAGEFDFGSAQLHDVKRVKDEAGKWVYTAVLLDAAGRTFESPMPVSEGESAYRTMQLIKSNPLLERVYRGVVMSVMDKVLKASQP